MRGVLFDCYIQAHRSGFDRPLGRGFLAGQIKKPDDLHREHVLPRETIYVVLITLCSERLEETSLAFQGRQHGKELCTKGQITRNRACQRRYSSPTVYSLGLIPRQTRYSSPWIIVSLFNYSLKQPYQCVENSWQHRHKLRTEENLAALNITFTDDDLVSIQKVINEIPVEGDRYYGLSDRQMYLWG